MWSDGTARSWPNSPLCPQNTINAYASGPANQNHGQYKEGDLVANFPGCFKDDRDCGDEMKGFFDIVEKNYS